MSLNEFVEEVKSYLNSQECAENALASLADLGMNVVWFVVET